MEAGAAVDTLAVVAAAAAVDTVVVAAVGAAGTQYSAVDTVAVVVAVVVAATEAAVLLEIVVADVCFRADQVRCCCLLQQLTAVVQELVAQELVAQELVAAALAVCPKSVRSAHICLTHYSTPITVCFLSSAALLVCCS